MAFWAYSLDIAEYHYTPDDRALPLQFPSHLYVPCSMADHLGLQRTPRLRRPHTRHCARGRNLPVKSQTLDAGTTEVAKMERKRTSRVQPQECPLQAFFPYVPHHPAQPREPKPHGSCW